MSETLTVAQIKEELTALGIDFDDDMKKAELLQILESETVESVSEVEEKEDPKKYVVVHDFKDLKDKSIVYLKGDIYPRRADSEVSDERILELMSTENKIGKQLIKEQD